MITVLVFAVVIAASLALAVAARLGVKTVDISEYLVGGRAFSTFLIFFLSAGEIYSIGTMTGFPAGIYAGGVTYGIWFLGYILLAYVLVFFIGPKVWRIAKRYDAMTMPDVMRAHFRSRPLELVVAFASLIFMVLWAQYQFAGLTVTLAALGLDINAVGVVLLSVAVAMVYVLVTGVRAPALVSVLKDILMLAAIAVVGVFAVTKFHGVAPLFTEAAEHGSVVTMSGEDVTYSVTTIVFQALGSILGTMSIMRVVAARSESTIQRSTIWQPLYMLMYVPLVFASYYGLAKLKVSDPNYAFTATTQALGSPWVTGLAAGAAALAGFLLLAVLALAVGAIISRNIVTTIRPEAQRRWVGVSIVGFLLLSAILAVTGSGLLLDILTFAYVITGQLVPAWLLTLYVKRTPGAAVITGIAVGLPLALGLQMAGVTEWAGINVGLLCLVVNLATALAVGYGTRKRAALRTRPLPHAAESAPADA